MKNCYVDREHRTIIDLVPSPEWHLPDGLIITRINVPAEHRWKGVARALLQQVLDDADKTNTTLYLEIVPSGGMNFGQLRNWYERRGFCDTGDISGFWRRLPATSRII